MKVETRKRSTLVVMSLLRGELVAKPGTVDRLQYEISESSQLGFTQ